jgi:hypothetical protein
MKLAHNPSGFEDEDKDKNHKGDAILVPRRDEASSYGFQ